MFTAGKVPSTYGGYQLFEGKESVLDLKSIDLKLSMADIYRYIEIGG